MSTNIPSLEELCEAYGRAEETEDDGLFVQSGVAKQVHTAYGREGLKELSRRYRRSLSTLFVRAKVGELLHLRQPMVSYGHFVVVAYEKDPASWLEKCVDNEWSLRDLRKAVADSKQAPQAPDEVLRGINRYISRGKDLYDDAKQAGVPDQFRAGVEIVSKYSGQG